MNNSQKITLTNDLEELTRINALINSFSDIWNIGHDMIQRINLAVEEIFLNIIEYGYQDEEIHLISFEFINNIDILIIEVVNDAVEFDIINYPMPKFTSSIEELEAGGLGIFLMKKMVDTITSTRINGINTVQLVINLTD